MIKDLIIKDDFFSDPQKIVALAKQQQYYAPTKEFNWVGMRSPLLNNMLNEEDMRLICDPISKHLFHSALDGNTKYSFQYDVEMYFHYLDENIKHTPKFFHKDTNLMAGVIYLTENPKDNSGTVVIENKNEHRINNKFNRCVIYNSNFSHAALNGFGKTVEDARLTLTLFFNEIHIIKCGTRN